MGIVSRVHFFLPEKKKEKENKNTIISKISLDATDEIQKNSKDEKHDAASNPKLSPWKGESLSRALHAVLMGTAHRPASFL